jgi:hypothetical protein
MINFDPTAMSAVLANPRIDGAFEGEFGEYTRALGAQRPLVLLAFAPKSAGTFFRSAVIEAIDGQLGRIVHAEGGRDPSPYLPYLLAYFMGGVMADTLVTHTHMPASTGNRHIIEAFDLKPIIMIRSIPDMLASFLDMLEKDPATPIGLSFLVPDDFAAMPRARKADFMIDMMAPWYAQYFAGWKSFADEASGRVCILSYDDFCDNPLASLEKALAHAGVPRDREECEDALDAVWTERDIFRYNRAQRGRGGHYFTTTQIDRIARQLSHYSVLAPWREQLLRTDSPEALRAAG